MADPADAFFAAHDAPGPSARAPLQLDPRRVLLTVAVVVGCAWLLWPLRDELRFAFASDDVVELGDATTADLTTVRNGAYVRVTGVVGNKAATLGGFRPGSLRQGPVQVREILGAPLYVEFAQGAHDYGMFSEHTLDGRIVPFAPGGEMEPVRAFFAARGAPVPDAARLLIVDEAPGPLGMARYLVLAALCCAAIAASIVLLLRSARGRGIEGEEWASESTAP